MSELKKGETEVVIWFSFGFILIVLGFSMFSYLFGSGIQDNIYNYDMWGEDLVNSLTIIVFSTACILTGISIFIYQLIHYTQKSSFLPVESIQDIDIQDINEGKLVKELEELLQKDAGPGSLYEARIIERLSLIARLPDLSNKSIQVLESALNHNLLVVQNKATVILKQFGRLHLEEINNQI